MNTENVTFAVLIHAPATRKASVPLKRRSVNYVSDSSQEESEEISESSEDEKRRIETVTHQVEIQITGANQ